MLKHCQGGCSIRSDHSQGHGTAITGSHLLSHLTEEDQSSISGGANPATVAIRSADSIKSLMLWKDDFVHERDWFAVCDALSVSRRVVELELKCRVCVTKEHYTHGKKDAGNT